MYSKSSGAIDACSFGSHDPHGMNAALRSLNAVCDWMWSMPGVP
jgi:hypothetical protein